MITAVAFATVNCADQKRAKTFYTDVLGIGQRAQGGDRP